jgi:hypothetical protein
MTMGKEKIWVSCPSCKGEGYRLHDILDKETGEYKDTVLADCGVCDGATGWTEEIEVGDDNG